MHSQPELRRGEWARKVREVSGFDVVYAGGTRL